MAKKVTVFQRTPNWVVPRMDAPVSPFMRNILRYLPPLRWRKRALQMDFRESTFGFIENPDSDVAGMFKDMSKEMMQQQLPNQPELWKKFTPNYNVGCKRIIISDDYFPAFNLPQVELETRAIDSISGNAVKVTGTDGQTQDVDDYDLLVCATGFQTTQFMHPIKVFGKNGRSLNDVWKDGAQAYLGVCVEDMPNFAVLYGPNTNLGHNSEYSPRLVLSIGSQCAGGYTLGMTSAIWVDLKPRVLRSLILPRF